MTQVVLESGRRRTVLRTVLLALAVLGIAAVAARAGASLSLHTPVSFPVDI